jgi:glutamyl-tRNA synthetase
VTFLFGDVEYDPDSWDKVMAQPDAPVAVAAASAGLATLDDWSTVAIEATLRAMLEETQLSARKGLQPVRVAITGSTVSPPLFESIDALGRDAAVARLEAALARIG